jgi:hypothetical protein
MIGAGLVVATAALTVALPPPLCRGRSYDRFDPAQNHSPEPRAIAEIRQAYEGLCPLVTRDGNCGAGEIFENPTIGMNAITWVSGLGLGAGTRALIVYSAPFLNALDQSFGPGASFGVLAHEVGHHVTAAGNLRQQFDHSWDEELRADFFAGCALSLAGRPPDELEAALRALAQNASPSHPSFSRRNPKVRQGYRECGALRLKRDQEAAKKPGFGIGEVLRHRQRKDACWAWWYRKKADVTRLGPIAAPRLRSAGYASRAACEAARAEVDPERVAAAEPCDCPR